MADGQANTAHRPTSVVPTALAFEGGMADCGLCRRRFSQTAVVAQHCLAATRYRTGTFGYDTDGIGPRSDAAHLERSIGPTKCSRRSVLDSTICRLHRYPTGFDFHRRGNRRRAALSRRATATSNRLAWAGSGFDSGQRRVWFAARRDALRMRARRADRGLFWLVRTLHEATCWGRSLPMACTILLRSSI